MADNEDEPRVWYCTGCGEPEEGPGWHGTDNGTDCGQFT